MTSSATAWPRDRLGFWGLLGAGVAALLVLNAVVFPRWLAAQEPSAETLLAQAPAALPEPSPEPEPEVAPVEPTPAAVPAAPEPKPPQPEAAAEAAPQAPEPVAPPAAEKAEVAVTRPTAPPAPTPSAPPEAEPPPVAKEEPKTVAAAPPPPPERFRAPPKSGQAPIEVHFRYGSALPRAGGAARVAEAASRWQAAGRPRVILRCLTDRLGTRSSNLLLAERRCTTLTRMLRKHGVAGTSITMEAFGERQTPGPNEVPAPEARVARIHFR